MWGFGVYQSRKPSSQTNNIKVLTDSGALQQSAAFVPQATPRVHTKLEEEKLSLCDANNMLSSLNLTIK